MTTRSSFKAPQQSLKSSWKGIESFTQGSKGSGTRVTYNKGGRSHTTKKHQGEYYKGSNTTGYQY